MPDTLLQNLPARTAPALTDVLHGVQDPTGTPVDVKIPLSALLTGSVFIEAVQDVVGPMVAAAGGSYDDTGGTITLPFAPISHGHSAAGITLAAANRIIGGTAVGAAAELTMSAALDMLGTTRGAMFYRGSPGWLQLAPGTNGQVLTFNGTDPVWAAAPGGGGGPNVWALPAALADPASPVTPAAITSDTVIRITGITGAKTINLPSATGVVGRVWVMLDVTAATGGPFNVTVAGATHDGIGIDPGLVVAVPSGGRGTFLAYSDNGGAWRYSGDFDFAANKAAILAALGIGTLKARFDFLAPANGTENLVLENVHIGKIVSALCWSDQGTATGNLQIADKTGTTNYAVTGAASITGLGAISITSTPVRTAATGANTMAKTGNTDRVLQLVLSGVSSGPAPNRITVELEWEP